MPKGYPLGTPPDSSSLGIKRPKKQDGVLYISSFLTVSMAPRKRRREQKKTPQISDAVKEAIEKGYTDIAFPGAFGGVERLRTYLKKRKNLRVSINTIKKVLEQLPVYQMHVLSKRRFQRRRLKVAGAGIEFQADLAHMPEVDHYNYFLLMVDLWSNYVYVKALKTKTEKEMKQAFDAIFEENHLPKFSGIGTDAGTEFTSLKDYFEQRNAHLYIRRGPNKAFQAENFIRIFKHVLYRYLRYELTNNWPLALQKVADQLNHRRQKNLGVYTPADLQEPTNDPHSRDFMNQKFAGNLPTQKEPKYTPKTDVKPLRVNSFVYVLEKRGAFDKGFDLQRGTIYKIYGVDKTQKPFLYRLKEIDGTPVSGRFYGAELKPAPNPSKIKHGIADTLDEKFIGKKKYILVRWAFYPDKK